MIKSISNNFNIQKLGLKRDKNRSVYGTSPIKSDGFSQVSFSGKCQYCASIMVPKAASKKLIQKLLHLNGDNLAKEVQKFSEGFVGRFSKLKKEKRKRYIAQYVFWDSVEKMAKFEPKSSLKKLLKDNFEVIDNFESYLEFQLKPFLKSNDHIAASARGGRLFEENTGHVCNACNKIKGNKKFQNFFMVFPEIRKNMPASKFKTAMAAKTPSEIKQSMQKMEQESVLKASPKKEPLKEEIVEQIDLLSKEISEFEDKIKIQETEFKTLKKVEDYFKGLNKHLGRQKYIKAHLQKRKLKKKIKELGQVIIEHNEKDYQALLKQHLKSIPKMPKNYDDAKYKAYQAQLKQWNEQKELLKIELQEIKKENFKTKKEWRNAQKDGQRKFSTLQRQRPLLDPEEIKAIEQFNKDIKDWITKKGIYERKAEIAKNLDKIIQEQKEARQNLIRKSKAFPSLKKLSFKINFIDKLLNAKDDIPKKLKTMETKFREESSLKGIKRQLQKLQEELDIANARKTLTKKLEIELQIKLIRSKKSTVVRGFKNKILAKQQEYESLQKELLAKPSIKSPVDLNSKNILAKDQKTFRQVLKHNFENDKKLKELKEQLVKDELKLQELKKEIEIEKKEVENLKKQTIKNDKLKNKLSELNTKIKKKNRLETKIIEAQKNIQTYENLKAEIPKTVQDKLSPKELEAYQKFFIESLTDNTKIIENKLNSIKKEITILKQDKQKEILNFDNSINKLKERIEELPEIPDVIGGTLREDIKNRIILNQKRERLNKHLNAINQKIEDLEKIKRDTSKLEETKHELKGRLSELATHFKDEDKISKLNSEITTINSKISKAKKSNLKTEELEKAYAEKYEELEYVKSQLPKETSARSIEKIEDDIKYLNSLISKNDNEINFNMRLLDRIENLELLQDRIHKLDMPFAKEIVEKIQLKVLASHFGLSENCIKNLDEKLSSPLRKKVGSQTLRELINNPKNNLPKEVLENLNIKTPREYLIYKKQQLSTRKKEIIEMFSEIQQAKLGSMQVKEEKSQIRGEISSLKDQKGHLDAKIHQLKENLNALIEKQNVKKTK